MKVEDSEHPFSCELGILKQCDGSALLRSGECVVLCGVHYMVGVPQSKELIDRAYVEVNFRTTTGEQEVSQRCVEQTVRETLVTAVVTTQYPRSMISVTLHELEHQPGLTLGACINALSLALLDASISMSFVPVAVTCCVSTSRASTLHQQADIATEEAPQIHDAQEERPNSIRVVPVCDTQCESNLLSAQSTCVCIVFKSSSYDVLAVEVKNLHLAGIEPATVSADELSRCVSLAQPVAAQLLLLFRRAITSKFSRQMAWKSMPPVTGKFDGGDESVSHAGSSDMAVYRRTVKKERSK